MASANEKQLSGQISSRRKFLVASGLGAGAAATGLLTGCPMPPVNTNGNRNANGNVNVNGTGRPNIDLDVLNFALNLEYLEAEYYLRAIGQQLNASQIGNNPGAVTGGSAVPGFSDTIRQYAEEIAADELAHVILLRSALGANAVARPVINLRESFTAAALAAGLITAGQTFDPFANETNFLLGAFLFEDVGVTAYKGAAPLLTDPGVLASAAGLLGVEAYHAGEIRTVLYSRGADARNAAFAISNARDALDGSDDLDQPVEVNGRANIVPTDSSGLVFSRTTSQVLRIVYLNPVIGVTGGGFFPNGVNGTFRTT